MIPGKLVRFLEQYANVAFAGIRDRDLVPFGHRVSGWRVGVDQRTMTIMLPDEFLERLVESLQHNGELAVTVEESPTHETYQFKGRYLRHREIQDDDNAIVDRIRRRFAKSLRQLYPDAPEDVLNAFVSPASLAVDFEVAEIYLQTPGPGAGTRLVPPMER
ncbi:MAG TPA: hypothetical protein VKB50_02225 [Vicinamibacterales bacterium]|nr:hypothetical protein [Vicinamibacterales bacterium]